MPEEMILLRNALDARGTEWINATDNLDRSFPFLNMIIYRTQFYHKTELWSVISGYGTLGGYLGLLELRVGDNEVIGGLTAKDILERMDND